MNSYSRVAGTEDSSISWGIGSLCLASPRASLDWSVEVSKLWPAGCSLISLTPAASHTSQTGCLDPCLLFPVHAPWTHTLSPLPPGTPLK